MKNRFILIFLLLLLDNGGVYSNAPLQSDFKHARFELLLTAADNETKGWQGSVQLFYSKSFNILFDSSLYYFLEIKAALADTNITNEKKTICIYSVQKFELNEYIDFTNYSLQLFIDGKINEWLLRLVVFPQGFKTDMRFAQNYKVKSVRVLLSNMMKIKNISRSFKEDIRYIYSGKMLREREKMERSGFEE
jgi:hypothetical protein